jgi:ribosomal protein L17
MVTSDIKHEGIKTNLPKAKELSHLADNVICYVKKDNNQAAYGYL